MKNELVLNFVILLINIPGLIAGLSLIFEYSQYWFLIFLPFILFSIVFASEHIYLELKNKSVESETEKKEKILTDWNNLIK